MAAPRPWHLALVSFLLCAPAAAETINEAKPPAEEIPLAEREPLPDRETHSPLDWLAGHQAADGRWDADGFGEACRTGTSGEDPSHYPCPGAAPAGSSDLRATGLALLAMLGSGNTHRSGRHKLQVKLGLRWLKDLVTAEGGFGKLSMDDLEGHAIATLALAEAYALSGQSPVLRPGAMKALEFLVLWQGDDGGWGASTTSNTSHIVPTMWAIMALKSARVANLFDGGQPVADAASWIDARTLPSGAVCETPAAELLERGEVAIGKPNTEWCAMGVVTRAFTGAKRSDPLVRAGAELVMKALAGRDPTRDTISMRQWYFETLAIYQVTSGLPRGSWRRWQEVRTKALLARQCQKHPEYLSWAPIAPDLGRIEATALACLCLDVHDRGYRRVFR